ncbi:MAG: DUF2190 family protein [Treponema sp.]
MTGEYKLLSTTKTIAISDITVPAGQSLDKHGIVFVGDRVGVVMEKVDDANATVCFDTQRDWTSDTFDEGNLPKIGEKIYLQASDGKLTKTSSGNKLVGYFWKRMGTVVIFSVA